MLLVVWAVALVLLALTELAVRTPWGRVLQVDPRGRGRGGLARQEPVRRTSSRPRARRRARGHRGLLLRLQFSFFSPDDFQPLITFYAWLIVMLGGAGRDLGGAGRRADLRAHLRRHALLRLPAVLVARAATSSPTCGSCHRARADRADVFRPRGCSGSARRWCSSERLLEVRDVSRTSAAIRAVDGASSRSGAARSPGLIGPNGAGKTTLFNIVAGYPHRRLGLRAPRRAADRPAAARPRRAARARADLPAREGARPDDRARQHGARRPRPAGRAARGACVARPREPRVRAARPRTGARAARARPPRRGTRRLRRHALGRPAEAARVRARADDRADARAARRADGGRDAGAARAAARAHPRPAPRHGRHLPAHRARHGRGDARQRPRDRARERARDREGPPDEVRRDTRVIDAYLGRTPRRSRERSAPARPRALEAGYGDGARPATACTSGRAAAGSCRSSGRTAPGSRRC